MARNFTVVVLPLKIRGDRSQACNKSSVTTYQGLIQAAKECRTSKWPEFRHLMRKSRQLILCSRGQMTFLRPPWRMYMAKVPLRASLLFGHSLLSLNL